MSTKLENAFTEYEFNENDVFEAQIFSTLQMQHLMTERSKVAQEMLMTLTTMESDEITFRRVENMKGKLDILNYLIELSHARRLELQATLTEGN